MIEREATPNGRAPSSQWDDRLRKFYQAAELTEESLREIRAARPRGRVPVLPGFAQAVLACAAGLLAILGSAYAFGVWQEARLYASIAGEVAGNHARAMPVEFYGSDLGALAVHFERLEFSLIDAQAQLPEDVVVLGARYCTLRGRLAAQLQLRHSSGRLRTLYVAPAGAELAGLASDPVVRSVRSVNKTGAPASDAGPVIVRIWRARGLLFGLAADSDH